MSLFEILCCAFAAHEQGHRPRVCTHVEGHDWVVTLSSERTRSEHRSRDLGMALHLAAVSLSAATARQHTQPFQALRVAIGGAL
jgi:hypothetical protein